MTSLYEIYIFRPSVDLDVCDMKQAEYSDFNKFYGIQDFRNHFTIAAADACDSDITFKPVLPQAVLKADHSLCKHLRVLQNKTSIIQKKKQIIQQVHL